MAAGQERITEAIRLALKFIRQSTADSDESIYEKLTAERLNPELAARLVEFLPIAYTRILLTSSGARFSNTFRRNLPDGTSRESEFSANPVWNAVESFAQAEIARGISQKELLGVAARSAEFDAANKLLKQGSKLSNLVFTPPAFLWPESGQKQGPH
jgi:hypothetical protein